MLSYNDIIGYKFEKAGFGGGYRPEDVDKFTMRVATDFQKLEAEKAEVEQKLMTLAGKVEEYREDEESLRAALLGAQKLGDSIIRESKQKGEMMIAAARGEAQRVTDDVRHQIEREQGALTKIQQEVSNFKNRLLQLYKQHLELISSIPGQDVTVDAQEIISSSQNTTSRRQRGEAPQGSGQFSGPRSQHEPEPPPIARQDEFSEQEAVQLPVMPRTQEDPELPPPQSYGHMSAGEQDDIGFAEELFRDGGMQDDFSDIVEGRSRQQDAEPQPEPEPPTPQRESRFGELKFGDGYDLTRNSRR